MKGSEKRSFILVNFAVLLFGLAGLFAKWIHLPALVITFGRVFFSSIVLGIFLIISKQDVIVSDRKDMMLLIIAGMILAAHWWSFLASIQISTVAVGTITFSAFPLFVTFFEPLVFHQKLKWRNVLSAMMIVAGVLITIPEFSLDNKTSVGILVGLGSAFLYAILTIMNKIFSEKYSGTLTAFYEQLTAVIVLLPFVLKSGKVTPSGTDLVLLLFLGIVTTAAAHTMFITGLKDIPAQLAGICSSMETVYGIIFAMIFLGETPTIREIIGALVIITAVIWVQRNYE